MKDMKGTFAFSLNAENYTGAFDTRVEALKAGLEVAQRASDSPRTVYVGQRNLADPQAQGHADAVLLRMRERAVASVGGAGGEYLTRVNEQQAADLDFALETAILGWLKKQQLMPTRFNVGAISEHPVPLPMARAFRGNGSEVHELGVSETESPPEW